MIYLDNAATSFPKPPSVAESVYKHIKEIGGNAGRSSHQGGLSTSRVLYETRSAIAQLINCRDPLEISFTLNATEGLNTVIKGGLFQGDHVVTTSMEHNSVLRPLVAMEEGGVTHTIVWGDEEGHIDPARVAAAMTPATRMLIVNHCSNVTGTVQPLAELISVAHQQGVNVLVDASQSCGSLPIDVEALEIDYLAAPGHKALFGPQGTGFLYVNKKHKIKPLKQGGTGSRSEDLYQPHEIPDCYESGTQNSHGLAGLLAGVQFILDQSVASIHQQESDIMWQLWEGLSVIKGIQLYGPPPSDSRGSVIAFRGNGLDVNQMAYMLDITFGISSRAGLHCAPLAHKTLGTFPEGTLRFSPGFFTTREEIERVLFSLNVVMKELL